MTAPFAVGDMLLGKYRVERVLGQGGMGMVLAARHVGLGELFAIKLMLVPEGVPGAQAVDRFLREARIGASLKGEHVVKVQDVGQLGDGRPYMVLEYLEGQDVASVLEKRGPLRIFDVTSLMLQACEALAEAHAQGIVHRDLKPANMFLIRKPNGEPSLKLLDFGISKRLNSETKALTATGAMMGSPLYMSPEQLADPRAVGPQSDIWAMGVVLYELVTGHVPFDGEVIGQLIQAILNREPTPPSTHRPGLPAQIDRITARCLQKNPQDRYATVQELAADIRALQNDPAVAALDAQTPQLTVEVRAPAPSANDIALDPTVSTNPDPADKPSPNAARSVNSNANASALASDPNPGSSKRTSLVAWGLGGVLLVAFGGFVLSTIQGNSSTTPPPTADGVKTLTPMVTPAPQPAPEATSMPVASASASASSSPEPTAPAVPGTSAKPIVKATATVTAPPVTTATSTTKKKREGLF